jgi:nucleotidyltransferase substrate binding protein (TIGR01987 family)
MEKLEQKMAAFEQALGTLDEILSLDPTVVVRDASIQRFEYTFEAAWKALKLYLYDQEGVDVASPKSCIREAFKVGLLDQEECASFLTMVNDRNLTSHTYVEAVAQEISAGLPNYARLLRRLLDRCRSVGDMK